MVPVRIQTLRTFHCFSTRFVRGLQNWDQGHCSARQPPISEPLPLPVYVTPPRSGAEGRGSAPPWSRRKGGYTSVMSAA
jgi:hypothetical protein